jgi:hypothetical protein
MKLQQSGTPKRLIDRCWDIAEKCSDPTGFVSLRSLADYCRCQVVTRPLLVEAAITRKLDEVDSWVALLNNEVHVFSDEDFELESSISHLAVRTRNTLAHEIAHAVAWDNFGHDFSRGGTLDERLSFIERSVEIVSPLLLVPRSALATRLSRIHDSTEAVQKIDEINSHFAVSPGVFFNALTLFSKYYRAQFLQFDGVLEALWGVVEAKGKRKFCVSSRRLFPNYFSTTPNEIYRFFRRARTSEWNIEQTLENKGSLICFARCSDYKCGEELVSFEFSRAPLRKGQLITFRLSKDFEKYPS